MERRRRGARESDSPGENHHNGREARLSSWGPRAVHPNLTSARGDGGGLFCGDLRILPVRAPHPALLSCLSGVQEQLLRGAGTLFACQVAAAPVEGVEPYVYHLPFHAVLLLQGGLP